MEILGWIGVIAGAVKSFLGRAYGALRGGVEVGEETPDGAKKWAKAPSAEELRRVLEVWRDFSDRKVEPEKETKAKKTQWTREKGER